jgi:type I restriction enzyme R subunit
LGRGDDHRGRFVSQNEADTCRKYVLPKLQQVGWETEPHRINEQVTFTDGRIVVAGRKAKRRPGKRADYILRLTPDVALAVVEAKPTYKKPGDGLQQAKEYAEILGLKFAYATNGHGIVEFDYTTGKELELDAFPAPDELWRRQMASEHLAPEQAGRLLTPANRQQGKVPRYYQEIAINRAIEGVLKGEKHILLTMATGTGKTDVAFQICWKLWSSRWNARGETNRRPRILYLADRSILIDDPMSKTFAPFGDARCKIEGGKAPKSREMYFAIYQAIAKDEARPGLYKEYAPDFFDLIIVDECHRGSAKDESNWREILEYFAPAYQIGMTATPLRNDNIDTYRYFGSQIYTYSLKQGIDDGFLAPYRVHRVITEWDAAGWRPSKGEVDRYGREIPDEEYETADFERVVALRARTRAVAHHLTEYLKSTDRFGKTIVFCVDQEHADEMRRELNNMNADLVAANSDWVCRVTSDEGDIGRGHLSHFQDLERQTPVILTTSKLLTTGVDAPTTQNIVLVRVINSMTEFKQIIGRGTRVRSDYGKLFFTILDYTGSATRLFADPDFDGEPVIDIEEPIDENGDPAGEVTAVIPEPVPEEEEPVFDPTAITVLEPDGGDELPEPRKYYVDGGTVAIAAHLVYELDPDGHQLRVAKFTDYTAEKVRTLFANAHDLCDQWADPVKRSAVIELLGERGIDFEELAETAGQPDADPLDLLCFLAFNAPLRTRRERARRLRSERKDFFAQYGPEAQQVLDALLDKYTEFGAAQFELPAILELPPINRFGNVVEIGRLFGGPERLRQAVNELQTALYAA